MSQCVATYPPLGQVTIITTPRLEFSCVLQVESQHRNEPWEVVLRYAAVHSDTWNDVALTRSQRALLHAQKRPNMTDELFYEGGIELTTALQFEIMYRSGHTEPWTTAEQEAKANSIMVPAPQANDLGKKSVILNDYLEDLNPDLKVRLLDESTNEEVTSWLVETPVAPASGEFPHMEQVMFGQPFGGKFLRWFGISRNKKSWMAPRQGKSYFKIDVSAIFCSFLNARGEHLQVLGLSGLENIMTVFGDNNEGALMIKIRNERALPGNGRAIVSVGDDFDRTLESTMQQARAIFRSVELPSPEFRERTSPSLERNWADQWLNGLIYSHPVKDGQQLTKDGIAAYLDNLAAKGINISGLILPDAWQNADHDKPTRYHAGLIDFEADTTSFKLGLKDAITSIKIKHQSLRHVILSHPIFGHWGGISSNGRIAQKYTTIPVERSEAIQPGENINLNISLIAPGDINRFYHDYYSFLSSCEITSVQADAVYLLETLSSAISRCCLADQYLDAQHAAAQVTFDDPSLASMSLAPCALFHAVRVSKTDRKQVVRNSATFPNHKEHIFVNAHNATLSAAVGNIPDWGPIESTSEHGAFHIAARNISGGPIQISSFDGSDEDDMRLVQQVSGSTGMGKTVVFRPAGLGRAMNPYIARQDNALLKIGNTHDQAATELIRLQDFPRVNSQQKYIIKASSSGVISSFEDVGSSSSLQVHLQPSKFEIFCAYPLKEVPQTHHESKFHAAVLGHQGKLIGAAAIISNAYELKDGQLCVKAVLKSLGILEIYISDLCQRLIDESKFKLRIQGKELSSCPFAVDVTRRVLSVDLEYIWNTEKIESKTDEIYVELFFK